MTRVHHSHHGAHASSALDRSRAVHKKKPYKVVMEIVTQEKKKLHSVMTYTADAPRGYAFVPLGNRDLTEYCKEKCRERNLLAHIVSAKSKAKNLKSKGKLPEKPTKQNRRVSPSPERDGDKPRIDTQRIGHHFPIKIVDEACDVLDYTFRNGAFQKRSRNYEQTQLGRSLHNYGQQMQLDGRPATATQTKDQIRSAILEVFPKIPEEALTAIVSHAFEEGTNRVGNAEELTLARRVQLAVGAYIRHQYTEYDKMLANGHTWREAREKAQPITYAKLREWRDEGESKELEEAFREIIVLDDDDDDDDGETSEDNSLDDDERDSSLEIFSSHATARELQPDNSAWDARADPYATRRNPGRRIYLRPVHRNTSSTVVPYPARRVMGAPPQPLPSDVRTRPSQGYGQDTRMAYKQPIRPQLRTAAPEAVATVPQASQYIRDADGRVYHLQPIDEARVPSRAVEYIPSPRSATRQYQEGFVAAPPRVDSLHRYPVERPVPLPVSRRPSEEDIPIPSVENDPEPSPALGRIDNATQAPRYDHSITSMANAPTYSESHARRVPFPAPLNGVREGHEPVSVYKRAPPTYYAGSVPLRSPKTITSHRQHIREPYDIQRRPRVTVQPDREIIDLTSSPLRPIHGAREADLVPLRPVNHSYVSEPLREYPPIRREYESDGRRDRTFLDGQPAETHRREYVGDAFGRTRNGIEYRPVR